MGKLPTCFLANGGKVSSYVTVGDFSQLQHFLLRQAAGHGAQQLVQDVRPLTGPRDPHFQLLVKAAWPPQGGVQSVRSVSGPQHQQLPCVSFLGRKALALVLILQTRKIHLQSQTKLQLKSFANEQLKGNAINLFVAYSYEIAIWGKGIIFLEISLFIIISLNDFTKNAM